MSSAPGRDSSTRHAAQACPYAHFPPGRRDYSSTLPFLHRQQQPLLPSQRPRLPTSLPRNFLPSDFPRNQLSPSNFPAHVDPSDPFDEDSFSEISDDIFDSAASGGAGYPPLPDRSHVSALSSFGSSMNSSRTTAPTSIDLTQDSSPYSMPPGRGTKRRRSALQTDSDDATSSFPAKRRRSSNTAAPAKPKSIEQIDLSGEDDAVASTLQKQRTDQIRAQQDALPVGRSTLTSLQCTVCLEAPTDLTATSCGHVFCRACLMDWLVSADKEPTRRPKCPVCRQNISRTTQRNRKDVIPLIFMKKPAR